MEVYFGRYGSYARFVPCLIIYQHLNVPDIYKSEVTHMMKRSNFLALFAGLLLFRLLPAQTNLLLNAGFEEALYDHAKSWDSLGTVDFYSN